MTSKKKKKKTDGASGKPQAVEKTTRGGGVRERNDAPDTRGLPLDSIPLWAKLTVTVLLFVVAICVLYPHHVFENKVFQAGDIEAAGSFATPIKKEMAETNGYPMWNPYLFAGMPSYESLSYNPNVYPLSVVTAFLSKYLHFPNATWLLFHVFLLGLGVFALLSDRGVHFLIAAGAGVLMMWMPNQVAVGAYGHGTQANAVAYIPFALFFWDRIWRGKSLPMNASALVIVLGFQLLRAHIQISYYTFALIGLHTLFFGVLRIRDAVKPTGDPEYPVTLGFFKRALRRERVAKKRLAIIETADLVVVLGFVVVGALLISAVLFLPVNDYSPYSIRGASESGGVEYDYATSWSLHPLESLTFIFPFSFGFGRATYHGHMPFTDYANYLGLIVVIFSVFAVVLARNRFVSFLVFVIGVATIVSFGKFFPVLYEPLFKWFPYFNKFRVPVMILIVQQFAFVLLFGLGLSAVARSRSEIVRKVSLWGMVGGAAALAIVLLSSNYWTGGFARAIAPSITAVRSAAEQLELARLSGSLLFLDLVKFSIMLLLTFGAIWLFARRVIPVGVFVVVAVLLALFDIYAVDSYVLKPGKLYPEAMRRGGRLEIIKDKSVRDRFLEPDDVINFLNAREGDGKDAAGRFRVFSAFHPSAPLRGGDFATNRYMNFGISSLGGYHAAKLALYNDFIGALGVGLQNGKYQLVNMMNARYVVTAHPFPDVPSFRLLWQGEDFRGQRRHIYENTEAFPRVFLVDKYLVRESEEILEMLPALPAGGVDLREMVLLETEPAIGPVSAAGAQATIIEHGFNEIRVDATLPSAAILVMSEVYYPKWRVYVDGEESELLKADYVLRAVALPEGEHEIVFRYDSSVLKRGLTISVLTFFVVLVVLLVSVVVNFRRNPIWKH